MEKQTKITYWTLAIAIFSAILHNLIFALTGIEEAVFFFLTLIAALGFAISVVYNIILHRTKGKPKDIWKLGFLGLVGLIGLIPKFTGFFGFFGFFAFFGLRNNKKKIKRK